MGDITAYSSACKSWLYQDMLEKPSELLLYRPVEEGGLGLHHVQSKAQVSLISTFLQTAANPGFQNSLYHSLLYRRHCLQDETVPDLVPPPYYSREFFNIIKDVVENTPLNPVHMSVKQWYRHLLETNVTMEKVDDEGRMVAKLCKVEEREPNTDWQLSYHLGRLKGLSPQVKSFNFKMIHQRENKPDSSCFIPSLHPLQNPGTRIQNLKSPTKIKCYIVVVFPPYRPLGNSVG